jgi:FkbM family methyltransferase
MDIVTIQFLDGGPPRLDVPLMTLVTLFVDLYESNEKALVETVYDKTDRVLEAGSGTGYITRAIGQLAEFVCSVEGLGDYVALAKENCGFAGLTNVVLLHGALGTTDGPATFHRYSVPYASSTLPDPRMRETTLLDIPGYSLDGLVAKYDINALHLDLEGAEWQILLESNLAPINKVTLEMHPYIYGEERASHLLGFLRDAGFEAALISGAEWYPDRTYVVTLARPEMVPTLLERPRTKNVYAAHFVETT